MVFAEELLILIVVAIVTLPALSVRSASQDLMQSSCSTLFRALVQNEIDSIARIVVVARCDDVRVFM